MVTLVVRAVPVAPAPVVVLLGLPVQSVVTVVAAALRALPVRRPRVVSVVSVVPVAPGMTSRI